MLDRTCTAQEAVEMGLINRAVPADEVDGEVDGIVEKLLSYNQFSLRATKKWLNNYMQHAQMLAGTGSLFAEGMAGHVQSKSQVTETFDEYGKKLKDEGFHA